MGFLSAIPIIGNLIDRLIPDLNERNKAKAQLEVMAQKGELDLLLGQLEVNKEEAKSSSLFKSGWRPFVGWVCCSTLALGAIIKVFVPVCLILMPLFGYDATDKIRAAVREIQQIDISIYISMLLSLLGMAGLRSYEKLKGLTS